MSNSGKALHRSAMRLGNRESLLLVDMRFSLAY